MIAWNRPLTLSDAVGLIGEMARKVKRRNGAGSAGRARPARRAGATNKDMAPVPREKVHLCLQINGERREVACAPYKTLLEVLREDLDLTGTKHGCELGECGTCTVLLDGRPQLSCLALALECEDRPVVTVEGMANGPEPHPLQLAFAELGAAQCGYCTPGILLAARDLLDRHPAPSRDQIREALSGNLCRCTGYIKIYEAIELAARRRTDPSAQPAPETIYGRRG